MSRPSLSAPSQVIRRTERAQTPPRSVSVLVLRRERRCRGGHEQDQRHDEPAEHQLAVAQQAPVHASRIRGSIAAYSRSTAEIDDRVEHG